MNFVEQLFGLAPDGGNGTFELLLLLIPIAGLLMLRAHRARRDKGPRER